MSKTTERKEQLMKKVAHVGVDYRMNSLSIGVLIDGEKKIHQMIRLANEDRVILKYFKKPSEKYEVRSSYEASCSGYAFQRKMKAWGYACDVIAPSLIPRRQETSDRIPVSPAG
jgi:transposase